ncbi:MAG: AraC family transcriptional regulator [Bacteroidales bacterium]|nr:AraC family transcriptional regulator [Bacteroidales bacterium]
MGRISQYKSSLIFAIILTLCVGLSLWLSHYIPDDYFDNVLTPILLVSATTIEICGAIMMFKHSEGLRIRKAWGWALLVWGLADGAYILSWMTSPAPVMNMGAYELTTHELLLGNMLCWVMLLYPVEALRPGWLNLKRALWQLLPMFALVALDYVIPAKLALLIALYPFVILGLLLNHIHAYQVWCEENFSTLENIDIEWILRYLLMIVLVGIVYVFICTGHSHARGFTQQWLVLFVLSYATDQILFRPDPWALIHQAEKEKEQMLAGQPESQPDDPESDTVNREKLEAWMEKEKPYLNPGFKLIDMQAVLPMNRTYLSQFIHAEYGCTFYQFVNRYRIEEAKRLKSEYPELRAQDVSARCGFSSPTVFSRTFTEMVGVSPREWSSQIHSA